MADTYGDLLDTIADESRRPRASYGTQIERCVQEAIDEYSRVRMPWNQSRSNTLTTVASQEYYTSADASWVDGVLEFDNLSVTISATDVRNLIKRNWLELEVMNEDAASEGQPTHYAYWGGTLRLYPVPDDAWTVRCAGLFSLTRLSADADTNAWVTRGKGEKLIRCRASALFYGTYLRLGDRAAAFQADANAEYDKIIASLNRQQASGIIRGML